MNWWWPTKIHYMLTLNERATSTHNHQKQVANSSMLWAVLQWHYPSHAWQITVVFPLPLLPKRKTASSQTFPQRPCQLSQVGHLKSQERGFNQWSHTWTWPNRRNRITPNSESSLLVCLTLLVLMSQSHQIPSNITVVEGNCATHAIAAVSSK